MPATIPTSTTPQSLDALVARLREGATRWAYAPLPERITLARAMLDGTVRTAARAVALACEAKHLAPGSTGAGEEWMSGPYATARMLRQWAHSLTLLARNGSTPIGPTSETADGRLAIRAFPANRLDALTFMGVRADVELLRGVDEDELHATRARFYHAPDHDGRVCLVLGAGNINSIPATDVGTKLFNEGTACILKLNPVNAYLGPVLEEAFAEALARGVLAIVYGGAEEGAYLASHPGVDEVHITGSDRTHDAIVWGPPGPERAERMARGRPLLAKEITSELGNVTPILVVPGPWDPAALRAQAESVAGMVVHNASYDCISGKLLVLPRGWRQRDAFLAAVEHYLALTPARHAWYPGSAGRYANLVDGRAEPQVRRVGGGEPGTLPWTLVTGLDPGAADPAFRTEPFCAILSETALASDDPLEYLERAVEFVNERVWGTLCAHVVVHPRTQRDPLLAGAVERAVARLRYGTVSVNVWSGYAFGAGTTPWGAYPGASLTDIQSGRGFVHNTRMLEKVVVRHPVRTFPKPVYFPTHRTVEAVGRRLVALEAKGSWLELPGLIGVAVRG